MRAINQHGRRHRSVVLAAVVVVDPMDNLQPQMELLDKETEAVTHKAFKEAVAAAPAVQD
jgi:hypothetical protein